MNNLLQQVLKSQNPMAMLKNNANPQMKQLISTLEGKSVNEQLSILENYCNQNGKSKEFLMLKGLIK